MNATLIKVTGLSLEEDVTVQIKEDDIVMTCNHAGHHQGDVTIDGGLDSERTFKAEVCDKCDAWSYDGKEWNE